MRNIRQRRWRAPAAKLSQLCSFPCSFTSRPSGWRLTRWPVLFQATSPACHDILETTPTLVRRLASGPCNICRIERRRSCSCEIGEDHLSSDACRHSRKRSHFLGASVAACRGFIDIELADCRATDKWATETVSAGCSAITGRWRASGGGRRV